MSHFCDTRGEEEQNNQATMQGGEWRNHTAAAVIGEAKLRTYACVTPNQALSLLLWFVDVCYKFFYCDRCWEFAVF